jgi:hypothetical protein
MNSVIARKSSFVALVSATFLLACSHADRSLEQDASYEEFRAGVYQESGTGVFIVDGDTPVVGEQALREFFANLPRPGVSIVQQELVVALTSEGYTVWSDAQKSTLSYCISTAFGANHSLVQSAIATATAEWSLATVNTVRFVHDVSQDASCTSANNNVIFDVNPTGGQPYLARSFFPNDARVNRNLLIDNSAFGVTSPLTLTGVMRHELGHILGFRHEHIRISQPGGCSEDNSWYALTQYDSASVMHYPQCNGSTNTGDLVLTAKDKAGAASLYPVFVASLADVQGRQVRITNKYLGSLNSLDIYPTGNRDPIMNGTLALSSQSWYVTSAGNGWYRLNNSQLAMRSIDTYADTHASFMGITGNYSGQYWHLSAYGDHCFRMTNMFLGEGFSLDTYADTRALFMGTTGDSTGQCWRLTLR